MNTTTPLVTPGFLELQREQSSSKKTTNNNRYSLAKKVLLGVVIVLAVVYLTSDSPVNSHMAEAAKKADAKKADAKKDAKPAKGGPQAILHIVPYKQCGKDDKLCLKSGLFPSRFDTGNIVRVCVNKDCKAQKSLVGAWFNFDIAPLDKVADTTDAQVCYIREEDKNFKKDAKPLEQDFQNCSQLKLEKAKLKKNGWWPILKGLFGLGTSKRWEATYVIRGDNTFGTFALDDKVADWIKANPYVAPKTEAKPAAAAKKL